MLSKFLSRYIARALSSTYRAHLHQVYWRLRSKFTPKLKNAEVFLRANDPYSYLLVQTLPRLQQRYSIDWDIYIVSELPKEMYPEPDLWRTNALNDAALLAELYQIPIPTAAEISESEFTAATSKLLVLQAQQAPINAMVKVFEELWQGKPQLEYARSEQQQLLLSQNEQKLKTRGHYLSASIWYLGNWYWGLDRLDHLENLLNSLGYNSQQPRIEFDKTYVNFCRPLPANATNTNKPIHPIELFFSIRSPYSHLALIRCVKLSQHYSVPLVIKPVVPMVMRGLKVPPTKKFYIFFDTIREAAKLAINYGFVADPLGAGVRRCYALFDYAKSEGKEIDYLLSYSQAVNAEGILSDTDKGLMYIIERAGLNWNKAKAILDNKGWANDWPSWAEKNEQELKQLGLWGVPSIKYDNCIVWGQDRLEFIEQAIRKSTMN